MLCPVCEEDMQPLAWGGTAPPLSSQEKSLNRKCFFTKRPYSAETDEVIRINMDSRETNPFQDAGWKGHSKIVVFDDNANLPKRKEGSVKTRDRNGGAGAPCLRR